MFGFELTRKQRLFLIGICFLADALVYALYPSSEHPSATGEALLLFLAIFCIVSLVFVLREKDE